MFYSLYKQGFIDGQVYCTCTRIYPRFKPLNNHGFILVGETGARSNTFFLFGISPIVNVFFLILVQYEKFRSLFN